MKSLASVAVSILMAACLVEREPVVELGAAESTLIAAMPAGATPVPADYTGDGVMDLGFKAANGHWYLDVGYCNAMTTDRQPESGASCADPIGYGFDDDGDGLVNDGCPGALPVETSCGDMYDSDGDGVVNDGCPHCQGEDRYGGRWDYVYSQYGDASAIPVPADYGVVGGGVDLEHRVDLAIKDHDTGLWAIDYADNGFGAWDRMLPSYGFSNAIPVPADYDEDGRADLAIKTHQGEFFIDYAIDGFNGWNFGPWSCSPCAYFGNSSWIPIAGDFNGDGSADLAVTGFTVVNGLTTRTLRIDYRNPANTGFDGIWDVNRSGYGGTTTTVVPFNFDPWNGPSTDFGVKDASGNLYMDVAVNGFGTWDAPCSTPSVCPSSPRPGYGGSTARLTPGDFDGDGYVDLVGFDSSGRSRIDRGVNGWFGFENWPQPGTPIALIDNPWRPRYDATRPHIESTRIFGEGNIETTSLTVGVRYVVDITVLPGSISGYTAGVEINPNLGTPPWVKVAASTGSTYEAFSGESHHRMAITCHDAGNVTLGFQLRNAPPYVGGGEVFNPDYGIPIVCAAPAQSGLTGKVTDRGRILVDPGDDPDVRGIFVAGDPRPNALVTVYTMSGGLIGQAWSNGAGEWHVAATGGPYRVVVTEGGRTVEAVNVMVPSSGIRVDTPMPPAFPMLPAGTTYRLFIDYARGRTLMHTLTIDPAGTSLRVGKSNFFNRNQVAESVCNEAPGSAADDDEDVIINDGCPFVGTSEWGILCDDALDNDGDGRVNDGCPTCYGPAFDWLWDTGEQQGADAIMNGTWWQICNGNAVNYVFNGGVQQAGIVHCDSDNNPTPGCEGANVYKTAEGVALYDGYASLASPATMPMFTAARVGTQQVFDIVATRSDYADVGPTSDWSYAGGQHIWDVDNNGFSDVDHAIQIANPPLVRDCNLPDPGACKVLGGGDFRYDRHLNYDYTFARTSVGVAPDGRLFWVVADGEGVHGGNGATGNQLATFYKEVLGAKHAMGLDSGLSSEMLLRTSTGLYRVNTITGEDARIQVNPYTQLYEELEGNVGAVGFYVMIGPP